ncbi:MAG: flagellar biosynthetic protein FliP [Planctomycetota bacterium]|nr:MAG: flagellar biosynthetic protein FliP [Planctomycetota bacterium]
MFDLRWGLVLCRVLNRRLRPLVLGVVAIAVLATATVAPAQDGANQGTAVDASSNLSLEPTQLTSPEGITSALQVMLLLTVISLAPAIMMMTTSFVRIVVVLGVLRQALGTNQLPPSQVITTLALFMTIVVMTPTWTAVYENAISPYTSQAEGATLERTWTEGVKPLRKFMSDQIVRTGNDDDVRLFLDYLPPPPATESGETPRYVYYGAQDGDVEVPLQALLPAFMLSELKTAFLIGFQIYLPFLILDLIVASVTTSMGMLMLPPALISLPFKILLFVLLDGWHLVVKMLLESFAFT